MTITISIPMFIFLALVCIGSGYAMGCSDGIDRGIQIVRDAQKDDKPK